MLSNIKDDAIFVVACDMPFLNDQLMKFMVDKYRGKNRENLEPLTSGSEMAEWDAVIPVFEGKPQPLFGIYSKIFSASLKKDLIKD